MERCTTRDDFCQAIHTLTEALTEELWARVVDPGSADADAWLRVRGGAWLRRALGAALTARAERMGAAAACACGGTVRFRQHRPTRVHTVLPGRDVEVTAVYGQCERCRRGHWPVLRELGVDAEGFTPALQALGTLAAVVEPYETASSDLLGRMAGVTASTEKLQALVRDEGARATVELTTAPAPAPSPGAAVSGPLTVGIDGHGVCRQALARSEARLPVRHRR